MKKYVINSEFAFFQSNSNRFRSITSNELPEDKIENWIKIPNGFYYVAKQDVPKSTFPFNFMIVLKWNIRGDCVLLGFGLPTGSISYRNGSIYADGGWKIIATK